MCDVTIVCCWTNEKMYNDFVNTLKAQDTPYELIGIDNRGNKGFTSCAAAYNSVIDEIKTKYVIYSHQDILLNAPDVLSKFLSYLGQIGHDDILGVAGVRLESPEVSGLITDMKHPHPYLGMEELTLAGRNRVEGGIMECGTLDECFFGGYTQHFRDYPFDEVTCDNWHLYAAEACLNAKARANAKIWVCSAADIVHMSSGNENSAFMSGFCKLCRKYAGDFPYIRTTCGASFTDEKGIKKYVRKYYIRKYCKQTLMKFMAKINIYTYMRKSTVFIPKNLGKNDKISPLPFSTGGIFFNFHVLQELPIICVKLNCS